MLPVAFCTATFSSYRATTRYPEIPTRVPTKKRLVCSTLDSASSANGIICSFFSTARRTNQEAPPLLSGCVARRLAPPSGVAELAVLKQSSPSFLGRLASSRPDKGGVYYCDGRCTSYRAATRYPGIPAIVPAKKRLVCSTLGPASSANGIICSFFLGREKNEPRSAAAVIGLCRSEAGTALGGCGTRCAQTVLALIPRSVGLLPAR